MSEAIAKIEPAAPPTHNDGAVILSMLDKLIVRPDVPVERVQQMYELYERARKDAAKREYMAALSGLMADMPTVVERGSINTNEKDDRGGKTGQQKKQSSYALWEDVNEAIRPVLTRHGFALTFRITQSPDFSRLGVTAVLSHAGGHEEQTTMSLPLENSGSKNNVQGWGSSASYGKRYTAFAMLNIASRGDDDDGKKAGEPQGFVSDQQKDALRKLCDDTGTDLGQFLQFANADNLAEIPARDFARLHGLLTKKKMQKGAGK